MASRTPSKSPLPPTPHQAERQSRSALALNRGVSDALSSQHSENWAHSPAQRRERPHSAQSSTQSPSQRRGRRASASRHSVRGSIIESVIDHRERVKTGVRLRPYLAHEKRRGQDAAMDGCVKIEPPNRAVLIDPQQQSSRAFECDFVFDSSDPSSPQYANQQTVYRNIGDKMVEDAAQGFNSCLCAYGQTGTGKTHTVIGDWLSEQGRGLLPRIAHGLFVQAEHLHTLGSQMRVQASYIEIYNNRLRDLLASATNGVGRRNGSDRDPSRPATGPATPRGAAHHANAGPKHLRGAATDAVTGGAGAREDQRLKIHTHPDVGVYVENLSEHTASSFEEVGRLVGIGERARHKATTSMNNKSSRSHTIFSLKVEVCNYQPDDGHRMATVQVVDLAGRESEQDSECTGERFRELTFINRSLFQLANCVHALSDGTRDHIPFRNSKLTLLLSESFQHNSRTCLLAALTPSVSAYEENLLSLRFLESTGRIATRPVANQFSVEQLRGRLQDDLEKMRRTMGLDGDEVLSREALLRQLNQTWDDRAVKAVLQKEELEKRSKNAREAILSEACSKVGKSLHKAEGALERLHQENSSLSTSLGKAERHLSAVEDMVQQMKRQMASRRTGAGREGKARVNRSECDSRDQVRGTRSPSSELGSDWDVAEGASAERVKLPPLVATATTDDGQGNAKAGAPSVTFSISLPPLIVL